VQRSINLSQIRHALDYTFVQSKVQASQNILSIKEIMNNAKVLRHAPVLLVGDLKVSTEYFIKKCGFKDPTYYGDPENFCILHRDSAELMLREAPKAYTIVPNWKVVDKLWDIYYWVDDVEVLYKEMKEAGAIIDYELCDQPYGCREFDIQDPDGHDIAFGQSVV